MKRTNRWGVVSVITTLAMVLIGAVAFGDTSVRETAPPVGQRVHAHAHARLSMPLGLESSGTPAQPGSTLPGAALIAHYQGGRGAKNSDGSGRGRMIYTGADAWEPTLGIDKKGNIFSQGRDISGPGVVVSRDGGRSWDDVGPALHTHSFDPFVYVDTDTGRAFTADLTFPCLTVSHSDDVGKSWLTSEACGLTDHQNLFTGPPVSSSTIDYPNVVYVCAIDGGALADASTATSCLKSLDGGITWVRTGAPAYTTDPQLIPEICDGATGHGFVDSKGVVYLPRGWCGQPYLAISKDEGASWERIKVADNGLPQNQGGHFEHESAVAVDAKDNIYYFWTAHNRLPYLAISRDGGKNFSKPIMVGPPGLKEAWGPTMDIGGTGGIVLAYIGSTNAPGGESPTGAGYAYDNVTWNGYITTSVDALSRKPRFFTAGVNRPSDPLMRGECWVIRCGVQGDFIDVVIGPDGIPWTSMVDGCVSRGDTCDATWGFVGTVVGGPKLR